MRVAVCRLIESIGLCNLHLKSTHIIRYFKTLEECLKSPLPNISAASVTALKEFSNSDQTLEEGSKIINKFIASCNSDPNVAVARGYSQALGIMNYQLILNNFDAIFQALLINTVIKEDKDNDDSETRKYSIKSLE